MAVDGKLPKLAGVIALDELHPVPPVTPGYGVLKRSQRSSVPQCCAMTQAIE
jgi:hypothetical protein